MKKLKIKKLKIEKGDEIKMKKFIREFCIGYTIMNMICSIAIIIAKRLNK